MKTSLSQLFSVGLSALCLLTACQTGGRARTITDILDIIHRNQPHAEAQRREWLEIVQSVPPEDDAAADNLVRDVESVQPSMLPPLPDTADEIKSIAVALHADLTREIFLGPEANEQRVKEMDLSDYSVIAFATHGLVPGDLDGLTQPALALSSPSVAGVRGDALLTMEVILSLRLDTGWVVLSACNTGAARGAGAEAVSGLGRSFFYAGARSLLVSNWAVETTSARELTTAIFMRQAENRQLTRAESLREAMLSLLDSPGFIDPDSKAVVFSYAHPIFWAPFTLVGDAGGAPAGP